MLKVNIEQQLPVIKSVDLLVIGATVAGVAVAEQASSQGLKTMLIEPKTYCAAELGSWHRPWIFWKSSQERLIRKWFPDICNSPAENEQLVFIPDRLKIHIEDVLIKSGCILLYGCLPVACYETGKNYLLMIGNRSGLQLIKTKRLIDASENSLLSAVSEQITRTNNYLMLDHPDEIAHVSIELRDVELNSDSNKNNLPVMIDQIKVKGDRLTDFDEREIQTNQSIDQEEVALIKSAFSPENVILDIKVRTCSDLYSRTLEITKQLLKNLPILNHASVGMIAERPMRYSGYDPVIVMTAALDTFQKQEQQSSSYCISYYEPHKVMDNNTTAPETPAAKKTVTLASQNDFSRFYEFKMQAVPALNLPAMKTDVLVVGGGTAGSVAAYAAAGEEVKVILTEMNSILGGTGTAGGIHAYWFGLSQGFTQQVDRQVDQLNQYLQQQSRPQAWETGKSWNPSLKAFALRNWLKGQSVSILFNSLCVGVIKNQNQISGALFATENGPRLIMADFTIDATGDGDLACFAGADYTYGSIEDRFTMWSSLAQYSQAGQYRGGVFTTNADIGDVFDCTRYLLVNRRRGPDNCFDHGSYLTTRESRHIHGEYTVTFDDILMMKTYPDTVAAGFSNYDPKGKSDQDEIYVGVIPSQQRFALPLRAFIPRGLEGLLVTGKAISATHDALPIIRMQSDVQEQGGVCGLAAAWCVSRNQSIRNLDLPAFQKKLVDLDSLPAGFTEINRRKSEKTLHSLADVIKQVEINNQWTQTDLDPDFVLEDPLPVWQILNADCSEMVPLLIQAFQAASEEKTKLNYARLLAWHHHDKGASFLARHIDQTLRGCEGLPVREGSLQWSQLYPDQGIMTELTYDLNLLSRVNHPAVTSIVVELVNRIVSSERDYYDKRTCLFSVIDSIARIAEAKRRPDLVPALKQLLQMPEIFSEMVTCRIDYDLDLIRERLAMLKLFLARSLAFYGEAIGFAVLEALTQDRRIIIAKSAADCLYRLSAKRVFLQQPV